MSILDSGYRPTTKLDRSKPPKGGSAVPSTPPKVMKPQLLEECLDIIDTIKRLLLLPNYVDQYDVYSKIISKAYDLGNIISKLIKVINCEK